MTQTPASRTSPAPPAQAEAIQDAFDLSAAADAVAGGLKSHDFDVRIPMSEECCYLKVTNVRPGVTGVTICRNGTVDWQYQYPGGNPHDPDQLAAITLDILDADETPSHPGRLAPLPYMTFLGRIGLAAIAHDMRVAFNSLDPVNAQLNIHDELTVANPAQPRRGTVRISREGAVRWRCRIRDQPRSADGLHLTQITSAVAGALTSVQLEMGDGKKPAHAASQSGVAEPGWAQWPPPPWCRPGR